MCVVNPVFTRYTYPKKSRSQSKSERNSRTSSRRARGLRTHSRRRRRPKEVAVWSSSQKSEPYSFPSGCDAKIWLLLLLLFGGG